VSPRNTWPKNCLRPKGFSDVQYVEVEAAGMIKSSPSKIITQGTDWRFFNELKRELKG
jgi:hypothetical protein